MKHLMLALLFSACTVVKAQEIVPLAIIDEMVAFEIITEIDSLSSSEIHERTLNWFGSTFKSGKDVITSDTPSRIVGRFRVDYGELRSLEFFHKLTIDIKEGRLKFLVTNIDGIEGWLLKPDRKTWRTLYAKMRDDVELEMNAIYNSLLDEIRSNSSDW